VARGKPVLRVRSLRKRYGDNQAVRGKTVFLTTYYMDEAQALADRVAVIARGEIVAEGTPAELGGRDRAGTLVSFVLPDGIAAARLRADDDRREIRMGATWGAIAAWGAAGAAVAIWRFRWTPVGQ
jgi:ABC-type proline/glycine betaine transport system ATPase subunit